MRIDSKKDQMNWRTILISPIPCHITLDIPERVPLEELLAKIGSDDDSHSEKTIKPRASGARVFEIPMGSGILSQEPQVADWEGIFWMLNEENRSGEQRWKLSCREADSMRAYISL